MLAKRYRDAFWSRVIYIPFHECWEWNGTKDTCGYGRMYRKDSKSRSGYKYLGAHRASYMINKGPIKKGLCVMHSCDNPGCVNPAHLSLGTHKENMEDMFRKGRRRVPKGSLNGRAILTEDQVREIRLKYIPKYGNLTKLAKEYGMSIPGMWSVVKGKLWTTL